MASGKVRNNVVRVSVVIPYFNGQQQINVALESIYNQTYPVSEVVVVDDGSRIPLTQNDLIDPGCEVRLFRIENSGQSAARNTGAKFVRSDLISFLDQDDFYLPNHVENLVGALSEKPKRDWAYSNFNLQTPNKRTYFGFHSRLTNSNPVVDFDMALSRDLYVLPSAMFITKTIFEEVGGFDELFRGYEDDDLVLRLLQARHLPAYSASPSITWVHSAGSSSNQSFMDDSRLRFLQKWLTSASRFAAINLLGRAAAPFIKRSFFKLAGQSVHASYVWQIASLAKSQLRVSALTATTLICLGVFLKLIEQLVQSLKKLVRSRSTTNDLRAGVAGAPRV
jgi:glycosyltransferase involved in cell wall biosynthesis